jgi:hypothetical protein
MFDVCEYCEEHFLFWDFVGWALVVFMGAYLSIDDMEGDTIVNDAVHIKVQIVKPSVNHMLKNRGCTLGYCCPQ